MVLSILPERPPAVEVEDDDETASASASASGEVLPGPVPELSESPKRKFQDLDVWADESDNEWEKFKQQQKPRRAKKRKTKRQDQQDIPRGFGTRVDDECENEVDDLNNIYVPAHITERRNQFRINRKNLGDAGLRLPPDFSEVYFSDDERDPEELEERPKFAGAIHPCRPYEDIIIESGSLIPASIAQYLRNYQVDGVRFLHERFVYQRGAILGDDMGLGKTVQVAAFLTAAFGKTGDERDGKRLRQWRRQFGQDERWYPRVLIIAPGSLIANWISELKRWGWWTIEVYHGRDKEDALKAAKKGSIEVMITTYGTYKNDEEKINGVQWDAVIADECHQIKERRAAVTKAMDKVNALCRIGLTGTAIQNKYEEFWTLLNWTNPGHFGTLREWQQSIVRPLTQGQSHEASWQQLSLARKTAKKLVQNLLPRFFLRRMKSLIAHQLPKKSDRVVFCPLTMLQKTAYVNLLHTKEVSIVLASTESCRCGSGRKQGWCCRMRTEDGKSWMSLVFPTIQALQKISNHLTLLIPARDEKDEDKRIARLKMLQNCLPEHWKTLYKNRNSIHTFSNPEFCGKWKILKRLLGFWYENKDKVLVFSHSVRLLDILQSLFQSTSYSVSFLSGQLSYEDRQREVDDFNSDPNKFVFLISTKAGGVGLNITSANKVVIVDPHWNPAYDLQAQDRAYRIGQTRNVEVFRLVSAGTIEEIVYARQIYKQQQANIGYNASNERRYFKGVQQDKDRKGELFGLKNLFSFHTDQVVLQGIMNQTNIAEARVGAQLAEIDMSQVGEDDIFAHVKKEEPGEDDGGLSQLAAYIKTENPEKTNSKKVGRPGHDGAIQAILASVGVSYTHENSEVIGSSKVEAQLSRRAEMVSDMELDDDGEQNALFKDDSALFDNTKQRHPHPHRLNAPRFSPQFNPPQEVMSRQFCSMTKEFGFDNVTDFALAVEQMTQEERRDALDSFYKKRMEALLKEELEGGKNVDGENVDLPKAEIDGFNDDHKVNLQDEADGTEIREEVNVKTTAYDQSDTCWQDDLDDKYFKDKIKVEPKESDVLGQANTASTTSIATFSANESTMQSTFIYDDSDDEDEL